MEIGQYDIVLVDLNLSGKGEGAGSEIRKIRPCVVISPDEMNRHLSTIVVVPMTTTPKTFPTRVRVRHQQKTGWMVVDQIRTVDRKRIRRKLGKLTNPEIRRLKAVIRETCVE
jgi:mRNA interferase MazF